LALVTTGLDGRIDSLALITDSLSLVTTGLDGRIDSLALITDSLGRPEVWSYDANLTNINTSSPAVNDAVYYLNGNLVLYADSVDAGKNYTIEVIGLNLTDYAAADVFLYAENNAYPVADWTATSGVSYDTATFKIGYADIDNLVACTDGVVRATLVIDGKMTGLHLFFDIVAP
jgi:hypothetical protein